MPHSHGHHDHHAHGAVSHSRAFAISVVLNMVIVVLQVFYALVANSMSLLADAAHNFGDVLGLVLAWVASWMVTIAAKKVRYSYGYRRTTILAALINALLLVATAAIIAYESIIKLFVPTPVSGEIVIVVALIGALINTVTALLFLRGRHKDLNIKGAFLHLAADALISVGVAIGGVIILWTGWMWIDSIVGLLIVVTILYGTWGLLRDSTCLILDGVPSSIDYEAVENYLTHLPGVKGIHDLHIWGLSTTDTALTVHLVMPEGRLSDDEYRRINQELHEKYNIGHVTLQIEAGSDDKLCGQVRPC